MKKLLSVLAFAGLGLGLSACDESMNNTQINPGDFCAEGTKLENGKCVALPVETTTKLEASATAVRYAQGYARPSVSNGAISRAAFTGVIEAVATTNANAELSTVKINEWIMPYAYAYQVTRTTGEGDDAVTTTTYEKAWGQYVRIGSDSKNVYQIGATDGLPYLVTKNSTTGVATTAANPTIFGFGLSTTAGNTPANLEAAFKAYVDAVKAGVNIVTFTENKFDNMVVGQAVEYTTYHLTSGALNPAKGGPSLNKADGWYSYTSKETAEGAAKLSGFAGVEKLVFDTLTTTGRIPGNFDSIVAGSTLGSSSIYADALFVAYSRLVK